MQEDCKPLTWNHNTKDKPLITFPISGDMIQKQIDAHKKMGYHLSVSYLTKGDGTAEMHIEMHPIRFTLASEKRIIVISQFIDYPDPNFAFAYALTELRHKIDYQVSNIFGGAY